jgi:hypothetical protein
MMKIKLANRFFTKAGFVLLGSISSFSFAVSHLARTTAAASDKVK